MSAKERRPMEVAASSSAGTAEPHALNFDSPALGRLRQSLRRAMYFVIFLWLGFRRDPAADRLAEFWLKFDQRPPRPSEFAAARRIFAEPYIAKLIVDRAELGAGGLDLLRQDLVGELRRRAVWEVDTL